MIKQLEVSSLVEVLASAEDSQDVSLYLLGVPSSQQNKPPSKAGYPERFNPEARDIWQEMLESPEYADELRESATVAEQWNYAIRTFIRWANTRGVEPFHEKENRTDNNRIIEFMQHARMDLVKWFDRIKIFEVVSVSQPRREYLHNDKGFLLRSYVNVSKFGNAVEFIEYLTHRKVGFNRAGDGTFQHVIDSNIRVVVTIENDQRARMYYEIRIAGKAAYPLNNRKLTKKQYNTWIEKTLWLPIVRAHKFATMRRACLF